MLRDPRTLWPWSSGSSARWRCRLRAGSSIVGGAKQRALLAMLLLDANNVVSTSRLIEALWEDDPPETAQKALQVHISGLRKVVGKERVVTKEPGLPAAGRGRRVRRGPVPAPAGAGQAGRSARTLARGTAVGVQLEPLRPVGDRPARGRATRMSRGAHRSGPQSRSAHRADGRAGGARPAIPAARAAARAADPRPVPLRTPGRSAGRLPGGSAAHSSTSSGSSRASRCETSTRRC